MSGGSREDAGQGPKKGTALALAQDLFDKRRGEIDKDQIVRAAEIQTGRPGEPRLPFTMVVSRLQELRMERAKQTATALLDAHVEAFASAKLTLDKGTLRALERRAQTIWTEIRDECAAEVQKKTRQMSLGRSVEDQLASSTARNFATLLGEIRREIAIRKSESELAGPGNKRRSSKRPRRTNAPTTKKASAALKWVLKQPGGTHIRASDLYKNLGVSRQYLGRHVNPEGSGGRDPDKIDIAGRGGDKSNSPLLLDRESLIRWFSAKHGVGEASGGPA